MMGCRSTSTFSFDGGLVFSGSISLDNYGGFASARGPFDPEIERRATGATSSRVRALGDGKTYVLKMETGQPWSHVQRFATDAGIRRAYVLPVGGFQPVGRLPDPAPGARPLDPSTISRVAFCILDERRTWPVPTLCQRHRRLRTRIRPSQFYGLRARIWTTVPGPWCSGPYWTSRTVSSAYSKSSPVSSARNPLRSIIISATGGPPVL